MTILTVTVRQVAPLPAKLGEFLEGRFSRSFSQAGGVGLTTLGLASIGRRADDSRTDFAEPVPGSGPVCRPSVDNRGIPPRIKERLELRCPHAGSGVVAARAATPRPGFELDGFGLRKLLHVALFEPKFAMPRWLVLSTCGSGSRESHSQCPEHGFRAQNGRCRRSAPRRSECHA